MPEDKTRTVIAAGAIGNVLEWYDFAVYGYFAAAIGRTFFPQGRSGRPGAVGLRHLRRRLPDAAAGRRAVRPYRRQVRPARGADVSVTAMAMPTFLVGVLPGYAVLGVAAPFLLTLLRMIQGLSVGGEYTTSVVFMVEHAPPGAARLDRRDRLLRRRRRHPARARRPAPLLATMMPPEACRPGAGAFRSCSACWSGWPACFLRRGLAEERGRARRPSTRRSPRRCASTARCWLRLAGLSAFNAVGFYLLFVYIVSWLQFADGIAPAHALEINTSACWCCCR